MERRPARTHLSLYWPPANLWLAGHPCGQARAHTSLHWPLPSPEANLASPSPHQFSVCGIPTATCPRLTLQNTPPAPSHSTAETGMFSCSTRPMDIPSRSAGLRTGSFPGRAAEEPQGKHYFPTRTLSPGAELPREQEGCLGPSLT